MLKGIAAFAVATEDERFGGPGREELGVDDVAELEGQSKEGVRAHVCDYFCSSSFCRQIFKVMVRDAFAYIAASLPAMLKGHYRDTATHLRGCGGTSATSSLAPVVAVKVVQNSIPLAPIAISG